MSHPVTFHVHAPPRRDRLQLLIRLVLLIALGAIGCSSVYWIAYLALPALAALFILQRGSTRYLREVAPAVVRGLRWLAAVYAYLWLLTDELPGAEGAGPVVLEIETGGAPSAASALTRLVRSLPALLLMILLSVTAGMLWVIAALFILISEQVPTGLSDFLTAALRYQFRLIAYHLSLVDRYPSYESPTTEASASGAV